MNTTELEEEVLSFNRKLILLHLKATTKEQRDLQALIEKTDSLLQTIKQFGGYYGTGEDYI